MTQENLKNQFESPIHEQSGRHRRESLPAIHQAAKEGKKEDLMELISMGTDVNMKDQFGSTPLHLSCFHGHKEIVDVLLSLEDIEINSKDIFHRSPLFYAARNGYREILEQLLAKNADISNKTDSGETALLKASYYGHLDCIKILLNHKDSKINEGDTVYGNTPLHNAASRGHKECLIYLLQHKADVNVRNSNMYTPLHLAVNYNQKECVNILLSFDAKIDTLNKNGRSPIEDANHLAYHDIEQILKDTLFNTQMEQLKQKNISKWTCIDVAHWICLIGFPQYKQSFESNEIDGKALSSLTLTSLKSELNIVPFGHRTAIIKDITKLRKEFKAKKVHKQTRSIPKFNGEGTKNIVEEIDPAVFHIDFIDLQMGELLGKGFFGEVKKAIWKGTEVAVKVIYRDSFGSHKDLNLFYKELNIISKLRHPNVLMFLGASIKEGQRCIVTEYLIGGSLYQLIHHNWDTLDRSPGLRFRIISDIIKGMTYLHAVKILHRDLTSKNLLLDTNMNCKVADFGLSRIREESGEMTTSLGCLPYQAPEVFRGERYSETADVFSFGMVLFEMISGFEPNKDLQPLKFANMVAYENYRPNLPPCSEKWERMINSCWNPNKEARPFFRQLLQDLQVTEQSKFDALISKVQPSRLDYLVGAYQE